MSLLLALVLAMPAGADLLEAQGEARASLAAGGLCSTTVLLGDAAGGLGRHSGRDLADAAKTVYGEANPNFDEQCGVALVIFNRAASSGQSVSSVVRAPNQFNGYSSGDRKACEKLEGAVAAVLRVARGQSCPFGKRAYRYFCSAAAWRSVGGDRRRSEGPERIGATVFLTRKPC